MRLLNVVTICVATLATSLASAAPNTLVVCPGAFRAALAPWVEFRRSQGHELEIVDVPRDADALKATIRRVAAAGRLEFLVLVGDVPNDGATQSNNIGHAIPTNFVAAKINAQWGAEATIASDGPYADLDGDGAADLAVGRIPADTPEELSAVVRKILRYERQTGPEPWNRRLNAVAGTGGFGPLVDALIESTGQTIMSQALPAGYLVALTRATTVAPGPALLAAAAPVRPAAHVARAHAPLREQLNDGSLVWVYLGHGDRTELDYVAGPRGPEPILSVEDVPHLRSGGRCPLAVLMTCSAGAFDGAPDCLAEELLLAEEGPVAVIAASRVSMPYGNTVFGYEFLRASLADDRPATLGKAFALSQRRALAARSDDAMRASLDGMAKSLIPLLQPKGARWQPEDLAIERVEHVAMYHLFGDPLLGWRRPRPLELAAVSEVVAGGTLAVDGRAEFDGECLVELARLGGPVGRRDGEPGDGTLATVTEQVQSGVFRVSLPIPKDASGRFVLRAYLSGPGGSALGGANVTVRAAGK